jgi:hypothetical protein
MPLSINSRQENLNLRGIIVSEDLLLCLLQVIGRATVPQQQVRTLVAKGKNRVKAFNLFDGSRTIAEVASKTRIDQGNLSRSAAIWVENGIAFWVGEGSDARLIHLYPIPEREPRRPK